jgi:hypothetical protein
MSRGYWWGVRALLGVALAWTAPAAAQQATATQEVAVAYPATAALEGEFRLNAAASADVPAAIEEATRDAGFFVRNVGRGVLKRMLSPQQQLEIRFDSAGVAITEGDDVLHTPVGGRRIDVRNARGERESVATTWDGETLVRTFRADAAARVFRYRPGEYGRTLEVEVEVTGRVLPRPLRYRLVYEREGM